jgi:hypothetical protein
MSLESAPFYWIACDAPDCEVRCPDASDEYLAYSDAEGALETAGASDWLMDKDRHLCPDHRLYVCETCGKYDATPLAGERDYLCVEHAEAS